MTTRAGQWFAVSALCSITLLAYANSFQSGFVIDNRTLILLDDRVHKATLDNVGLILNHSYWWPTGESGLYRPVTTLSYLFNYAILGNADHPAGYHWVNLLLHIGNVLLLFALARRLVSDFWQAFLIAALWAVHPVLTESVTNIVGRADLLAGITTLGGLLLYLRSAETSGWPRMGWLAALMAVTGIGVFSKESGVAVAGIIALYEITWRDRKRLRGFLMACGAMLPALVSVVWIRARVMAASAPVQFPFVDNPIVGAGFWVGRLTAVKVLGKYLGLLVWPAHLSADYSYKQIPLATGSLSDWMAWLAVAAVAIAVLFLFRRNRIVLFAAGFSFLTLLPASNLLIPVGAIMAERFLYLPSVGFAICLGLALYNVAERTRLTPAVPLVTGLLITSALGARTFVRNNDWRDNYTLWSAAVETSPLSFKTHNGLAQATHVDEPISERVITDEVLGENEKSVAILDSLPDRLNNAGVYFMTGSQNFVKGFHGMQISPEGKLVAGPESMAKFERARTLLLRGLAIARSQVQAAYERGSDIVGENGDARLVSRATEVQGNLMLSETDQQMGKMDEALQAAREAAALDAMRGAAYGRIHDVLRAMGRKEEAPTVLIKGYLLTDDPELEKKLVKDYADQPDVAQCAISYAQFAPALNASCATVRKQACAVSSDVIQIALKARGHELAERRKKEIAAKYGC